MAIQCKAPKNKIHFHKVNFKPLSPTFFLSWLSIPPKSVTFMTQVSVFVRNIFIYSLFSVFLSGVIMRLSFTPPNPKSCAQMALSISMSPV